MPISDCLKGIRAAIGHERLLNPGVAAIIRNDEGRILLQKRSDDGSWSLPAGAIDLGETPAQAVVREAYEETGLHVVPEKVAGVFGGAGFRHTYPNGDKLEIVSIVFLCHVTGCDRRNLAAWTERPWSFATFYQKIFPSHLFSAVIRENSLRCSARIKHSFRKVQA